MFVLKWPCMPRLQDRISILFKCRDRIGILCNKPLTLIHPGERAMDGPQAVVDSDIASDNKARLSTSNWSPSQESPRLTAAHCRLLAALLIVGVAVLRIAYLACNCPLDLAPDEAHYW